MQEYLIEATEIFKQNYYTNLMHKCMIYNAQAFLEDDKYKEAIELLYRVMESNMESI